MEDANLDRRGMNNPPNPWERPAGAQAPLRPRESRESLRDDI